MNARRSVSQKRKYRVERNFGLVVGSVLTLFGIRWTYQVRFGFTAPALIMVGSVLVLLGIIYPRALVVPNHLWMKLAEILSSITTPIILAVVYLLVVTPVAALKRIFGSDHLNRRSSSAPSYWKSYNSRQADRRHYEKMY